MSDYNEFVKGKRHKLGGCGIDIDDADVHPSLFGFQTDIVRWSLRKGRAAIFLDTGLGKTRIQIEWARLLGVPTLIIAPLSVARQTVKEAARIGVDVQYVRQQSEIQSMICVTNYEMVAQFDPSAFGAVVLDESSILKSIDGKTRRKLMGMFSRTEYRLCCTATPAPNDLIEIGNHAEFLGICSAAEMRAMFFINANLEHTISLGDKTYRRKGSNQGGQEWRLKHHAEGPFYDWLSSWAICLTKPSDLGYDDSDFELPGLNIETHYAKSDYVPEGQLFFVALEGVSDRATVRRNTIDDRLNILDTIITLDDQWIIWCGLDDESRAVMGRIPGAVEIRGSDTPEHKANTFERFQDGEIRVLVTKCKIGGFGMNFQNAHKMAFFGLNDSWETWYQAIRREYRYGQKSIVDVHVVLSDIEDEIYANIMRKDAMADRLRRGLIEHISIYNKRELDMESVDIDLTEVDSASGDGWTALLGDSCERLKELDDNSIDLSVYSPPFADLYVHSNSAHDLGNSKDWNEFFGHYAYIIREVMRATKPGRLTCVHTSDIPAMASRDGWIGVRDFPGEVIRAYEAEGWTFVGRAFVQKNPQAQAIRVKSKALLFVQLRKDSADSRPALIDQVLLFKKPGDNATPIMPVANGEMDNETWIEWAHGIWLGIRETDTLQYSVARDVDDEKHICPLQLGTIERCIKLYSNPGETVLTPFMGIGSEAYMAIKLGRKAVGIELKRSYYDVAVKNIMSAALTKQDLFSMSGVSAMVNEYAQK